MVTEKSGLQDSSDVDTKRKILEAAMQLFALKGFEGTTIRQIAELAQVNVASLNYHFKSKENLRQAILSEVIDDFKCNILSLSGAKSVREYVLGIYYGMVKDQAKCLNQFKLFLDGEPSPCQSDDHYPLKYEFFSQLLEKEVPKSVPKEEKMWMMNVVFGYVVHMAVISSTAMGQASIKKILPEQEESIPAYIEKLVDALIRDLRSRFK